MPPQDIAPLDRLLDATAARGLDAVTFTSAPTSASFPGRAEARGVLPEILGALRDDVLAACVGPVTALPLQARSIPTVQPERFRLGPLVQLVCAHLPTTARVLPVCAGHRVEIRGHAVLVDDELRAVPPAGMALLHTLARRPGWVVARSADLLRALPGSGTDEHAVETAMARLRAALGAPRLIQTVVKRGYRLSLDPTGDTPGAR
ncbi:Uroporphyrinogen-III synthase OS=Streptomyces microflavus OX=1919 GN=G3I39_10995 PE=4 SV=1 [Streptomyces microflavus]